jgi:hypothetical protein
VVILAPAVQVPVELDKAFSVIEHELPGRQQLEEIARGIATEEGEMPEGEERIRLLEAPAGLTPPVQLDAGPEGLRVRARTPDAAAEFHLPRPGRRQPEEAEACASMALRLGSRFLAPDPPIVGSLTSSPLDRRKVSRIITCD